MLEQLPQMRQCYAQYSIPESEIEFEEKKISVPPKSFGSISIEAMNIGVMPVKDEIAVTPSLAKQLTEDVRTLIGKKISFVCGDFSKELSISGIYSGSFDDYYLDAETEQALYRALQGKALPVSVAYQVKGFDEVLEVEKLLEEQGFASVTASKQVESLKESFVRLKQLFRIVSGFVTVIGLIICGILLIKMARMRSGEMGLFMALGYRRAQIRRMLFWESMLLAALSASTAALIFLICSMLSGVLAIHIAFHQFLLSICAEVIFVWLIASISNARLLKTDPVKALKQ